MMANLFLKTLYQKRFMLLWWFIGLALLCLLTVSFFPSFKDSGLDKTFGNLPAALQKVAGDALSFKTIDGYITQQIYALRMPLLTIVLSIALLTGLSAGDEQKGLLETQLSLPFSRTKLLLQKLSAGLVISALASCGAIFGVFIGLLLTHEHYGSVYILQHALNCFVLATDFGLVAFTLAAVTGRKSFSLGVASGYAFLTYLINSMASSVSYLQPVDKFTLFHYYQNSPFSIANFGLLLLVGVIFICISCVAFNRRDIKAN